MERPSSSTAVISVVLVMAIVSVAASLGWSLFERGIDSIDPGSIAFVLLLIGGVAAGVHKELRTGDEAVERSCIGIVDSG